MQRNPQAEVLNQVINISNAAIFDILSEKGKNIFFPKKGILGQSADAKGKRINATIGSAIEDDGSPMRLGSIEKMLNIDPVYSFPYAPSFGRPDLRAKWKEMIYQKNPLLKGIEMSLPVVTNALTHGLSMVGYMFLNEGDTVIMPDLYWGNYNLIFKNAYGANIATFNTFKNTGFDTQDLEAKLNANSIGKKVLLLNFPNNPTGYSPTFSEAKEIANILLAAAQKGNKIVVVCDDAYFGLVFEDGIEEQSIFAYIANLHENILAVKVDGATKEDYVWGFRVGFITYAVKGGTVELYGALADKTAGALRGNISNACNLSQSLLLKAYESATYTSEKKSKFDLLKTRYDAVKQALAKHAEYTTYFEALPYNSGYFMCVKLKNGLDGEKIRQILLKDFDTGVIALGDVIRLAFAAVAAKDMEALFANIYEACKKA